MRWSRILFVKKWSRAFAQDLWLLFFYTKNLLRVGACDAGLMRLGTPFPLFFPMCFLERLFRFPVECFVRGPLFLHPLSFALGPNWRG